MYKLATIGSSWITDDFIRAVQKSGLDIEYTALLTSNIEKGACFAAKYGVSNIFTNIDELAESDVDLVYIATPIGLHYPAAKKLLIHGKHVLCEKTSVVNSQQLKRLYEIAEENDVIFMEAIKALYYPEYLKIIEALPKLGSIHISRFDFSRYSSKYPAYLKGERPTVFDPEFASGALMDMGIYPVYLAIALFGKPEKVVAEASFMDTGADLGGTALFKYPDRLVTVGWCKASTSGLDNIISGEKGTMHIESAEHIGNVYIDYVDKSIPREVIVQWNDEKDLLVDEVYRFIDLIENRNKEVYQEMSSRTAVTIEVMEQIRKKAGIPIASKCEEV